MILFNAILVVGVNSLYISISWSLTDLSIHWSVEQPIARLIDFAERQ